MKFIRNTLGQKLTLLFLLLFVVCFAFTHTEGRSYIRKKAVEETSDMLKDAGTVILRRHIEMQEYTASTIRDFQSHIEVGAETADCRILIIHTDGDVLIDTANSIVRDNVYRYDASFLLEEYVENLTLGKLIKDPVIAVSLPINNRTFLNGHIVLLSPMDRIEKRAEY